MPASATDDMYERSVGIKYLYGTAGFRMNASLMPPVVYRVSMLAAALSSSKYGGQAMGIMLTASHNPVADNGVKLVGPDGGMLSMEFEKVAEALAHTPSHDLETKLREVFGEFDGAKGKVIVGRDTRPSGEQLLTAVQTGVKVFGATLLDIGLVSTPELHLATYKLNSNYKSKEDFFTPAALEISFISSLAAGFLDVVEKDVTIAHAKRRIIVDCANGIGAQKITLLKEHLAQCGYELVPINCGDGTLNDKCGADYVKSNSLPPCTINSVERTPWGHYASLDGDADRLLYFTFDESAKFFLIDGDRISALCAMTLCRLSQEAKDIIGSVRLGVVQTAYANGASTDFIRGLGVELVCTSTGVKYLHEAAHHFDIGIYFEANGHGTILFDEKVIKLAIEHCKAAKDTNMAVQNIVALYKLANQLVGDGVADLLLVEVMLQISGMGMKEWLNLYRERPSCLIKVPVNDRTKLVTFDADRRIVEPAPLQTAIDSLVAQVSDGRAFARASGTEDVIRIYAEADSSEDASYLARQIAELLPRMLR